MGRGLIIVLVASLALNVFAGGFFAGRLLNDAPPSRAERVAPGGIDNPFRLMRHAEALPPQSRQAFREAFRAQLPVLRERHRELRRLRVELGVMLQADNWDRDAISAKMLEIDAAQMRQREAFNEAFLNAFESLSAEDRRLIIAETARGGGKLRDRKHRMIERARPPQD